MDYQNENQNQPYQQPTYQQQPPNQNSNWNYYQQQPQGNPGEQGNYYEDPRKSRIAAGIFGVVLGSLGIHNFYLGYTSRGLVQLLISVLSCGTLAALVQIWGIIEGILILVGDINRDAYGNPLKD